MEAKEAFAKLWSQIYNPHSACPDVSIGDVQDLMVSILMEDSPSGSEEESWVLTRLALHSSSVQSLIWAWTIREGSKIERPADEAEFEIWEAFYLREEKAENDSKPKIKAVIDRLIADGRVLLSDDSLSLP